MIVVVNLAGQGCFDFVSLRVLLHSFAACDVQGCSMSIMLVSLAAGRLWWSE